MPNILVVDNFDSFTWNLVHYLQIGGASVTLKRNNELRQVDVSPYQGVLLSPGPGEPSTSGDLMWFLNAISTQKPILGICLGHQAIGCYYGAKLVKGTPMHGKISMVHTLVDHLLFDCLPTSYSVARYHSLLLENLPEDLALVQQTQLKECMAIKHKFLPIWGIQYHPEAHLTAFGQQLISNWVMKCIQV